MSLRWLWRGRDRSWIAALYRQNRSCRPLDLAASSFANGCAIWVSSRKTRSPPRLVAERTSGYNVQSKLTHISQVNWKRSSRSKIRAATSSSTPKMESKKAWGVWKQHFYLYPSNESGSFVSSVVILRSKKQRFQSYLSFTTNIRGVYTVSTSGRTHFKAK